MIFINTRPTKRAKKLTKFLQTQNIEVIELPLLELVAKPLEQTEQQALNNIIQTTAVVLVSEEAAQYGLAVLAKKFDLAKLANLPLTWLAVGEKTASCFHQYWQNLTDIPSPCVIYPRHKQHQNNEGLLNLAKINSLKIGMTVQIWRGIGGRELLANMLKARGIHVELINFYQRILPISAIEKFDNLQSKLSTQDQILVLITSLTAWQHWQQLMANSILRLSQFHYVVLQQRIANFIQTEMSKQLDQSIDNITIIDDLNPQTILQAIHF